MEVFHYVANVLKDVPLFDNDNDGGTTTSGGAIYNDFDHCPSALMAVDEDSFSFSQTGKIDASEKIPSALSMQEATDHAVMAADKDVGIHYQHVTFDSAFFDNFSDSCDESYCQKVHKLVTNYQGCWDALSITSETENMFRRRLRTQWDMPDTVYDAWLIKSGFERSWFDTHLFFNHLYPDLEDGLNERLSGLDDEEDLLSIPSYQPVNIKETTTDSESSSWSPVINRKRRRTAKINDSLSEDEKRDGDDDLEEQFFVTPILSSTPTKNKK